MLGVERVAELLNIARQTQPQMFGSWQVVSLEHYSATRKCRELLMRSKLVPRIRSASLDYGRQLDRLEYILRYV